MYKCSAHSPIALYILHKFYYITMQITGYKAFGMPAKFHVLISCIVFAHLCVINIIEMCVKKQIEICAFCISHFPFPLYLFPFSISNFEFICGAALFCQLTALIAKPNEIGKYCSNFVIAPTLTCRQLSQLMSGSFNKTKLPSQVQSLFSKKKKKHIAHTTRCTSS